MIQVTNLGKSFQGIQALTSITAEIKQGSIFGLIGSNGAGKSTFLRLLAGIYQADCGEVLIEGQPVYENSQLKQKIFYISDETYFMHHSNMNDMAKYFATVYEKFSKEKYIQLASMFQLDRTRKLHTFSKGMQKQAYVVLALACQPDYLFCDETFDGLDPVMRQAVKRLLAQGVVEHNLTPIIASHNLRELEDICDHIGLLHQGGIVFERELDDLWIHIHKIQCAFAEPKTRDEFETLDIVSFETRGALCTLIVRGDRTLSDTQIAKMKPLYSEIIPLTLEEVFITEMEVLGYDVEQVIY